MANGYLEEMFGLKGKTAVITGGGGTLGGAMGVALARAGASVVIWDLSTEISRDSVKKIAEACGDPNRVGDCEVDCSKEESIAAALAESTERFGPVHILINAAGGNRGKGPITELELDNFEFVLKLNLEIGCLIPMKAYAKYCIEKGIKGSIINIASMAGHLPLSGIWGYNAAKAAVVNLTKQAACELAAHGIRVNAISPGFFLAKQNRDLLIDKDTGELTDRGKQVIAHTPFGRFGEPHELSGVTLLLASNVAGGFISGAVIPVDGAYLTHNI